MKRFRFDDFIQYKAAAIEEWCDSKAVLEEILTNGHADVHYRGSEKLPRTMNGIIDDLYKNEQWSNILPDNKTLVEQVVRVAHDVVPASHFVNKSTMIAALSETMLACATNIAEWVSKDRGNHTCRLRLTVDTGAFVGTGIGMDGNEYATTATTIILSRRPTASIDAGRVPFSVLTMYPDITGHAEVGTLVATGRSYGWGLARAINTQPTAQKMFFQLREKGVYCKYDNSNNGAAIVYGKHEDVTFMFRYNDCSLFQGQILVTHPSAPGFRPISKADFLTPEKIKEIREREATFHEMLIKAQDPKCAALTEKSPLFSPIEQGELIADGRYMDIEEIGEMH
jgi:hypothetical protein